MLDEIDKLLDENRQVMRKHRLAKIFPGWEDCIDLDVNDPEWEELADTGWHMVDFDRIEPKPINLFRYTETALSLEELNARPEYYEKVRESWSKG